VLGVKHQYIERESLAVRTERLYGDRFLRWAYQTPWEDAAWFCRILTSPRTSHALSLFNYDIPFMGALAGVHRFVRSLGVDLTECLDAPSRLNTPRKLFERKLRYWEVRPMDESCSAIVSPCDARMLIGSFDETSSLFVKRKFFEFDELFGMRRTWCADLEGGDFAIFRLTPDKYHYNHFPVSGVVIDRYEIRGRYHACNPSAVVVASPYAKNTRVVTILDTDVAEGSQVGLVAMIEIVALMIGRIDQCYSESRYDRPRDISNGMFVRKGQPKSLYRPGSSTTVAVFQPGRVSFCDDLVRNLSRPGVTSRFSEGLGRALVETDVKIRSTIGYGRQARHEPSAGYDDGQ
jgi:phosphatidylserine decarboxylase